MRCTNDAGTAGKSKLACTIFSRKARPSLSATGSSARSTILGWNSSTKTILGRLAFAFTCRSNILICSGSSRSMSSTKTTSGRSSSRRRASSVVRTLSRDSPLWSRPRYDSTRPRRGTPTERKARTAATFATVGRSYPIADAIAITEAFVSTVEIRRPELPASLRGLLTPVRIAP
ncbi:Uncharacterised protein [Klebsiella pneumoniae]|nr:hypothetical protein SL19_02726 [Klebsiella pneumoniae]OUH67678.1 hypothetical protein AZ029_002919 [Klebsiella pneumoniae]SVZ67288.1 Uncharacterised protein [Klebsiella pneumoniae]SVZ97530.1 Uncharacterised protein [Klebsiella pneumoniae]SWA15886.1 Uncharacterised protein [Klebsiella pneumoniae]